MPKSNSLLCLFFYPSPSDPGPIWWKAWSFWLPGPAGSSQCHPQANTGEKPGGGRAQQRRFRLRHQLLWDGPRQPGQLPALTPWTVVHSKWGQELKTKGTFLFSLQWRNKITEENATPMFRALVSPGFRIGIKILLYRCCNERRNGHPLLIIKKYKHHPLVKCWLIWLGAVHLIYFCS